MGKFIKSSRGEFTKVASYQPPVLFERKADVIGIARRYNYPGGMTPEQFDIWASKQILPFDDNAPPTMKKMRDIFNQLAAMNPGVETLAHDNHPRLLRHAIFGVASSMNIDDIQCFLDWPKQHGFESATAREMRRQPAYDEISSDIERRTGIVKGWVTSMPTLLKIQLQVKDRPAIHPVQVASDWRPPGAK